VPILVVGSVALDTVETPLPGASMFLVGLLLFLLLLHLFMTG
jgi:hypothetical protein